MSNYTGTVNFGSSDWQAVLPASYIFTTADKGVHTFTATLKTAGSQLIRVSEALFGSIGSQTGIAVAASAVTSITSSGPQHVVAGAPFAMAITARDAFGNLGSNYTGKLRFTATDTKAVLPADYTFTAADAGTHTFMITFKTATAKAAPWSVTAVDASKSTVTTTLAGVEVLNAAASAFTLAVPTNITAGTAFTAKLSVLDAFGNEVKDYTGTVHFSNTAGVLGLPADYTFNAIDAGVHSFLVTLSSTAAQTLSVTDAANSLLIGKTVITPKAAGTATGGGSGGGTGGGKKV